MSTSFFEEYCGKPIGSPEHTPKVASGGTWGMRLASHWFLVLVLHGPAFPQEPCKSNTHKFQDLSQTSGGVPARKSLYKKNTHTHKKKQLLRPSSAPPPKPKIPPAKSSADMFQACEATWTPEGPRFFCLCTPCFGVLWQNKKLGGPLGVPKVQGPSPRKNKWGPLKVQVPIPIAWSE